MDGWMDRWMEGDGGILVSDGKCYNEAFFKLYEARCDERGMEENGGKERLFRLYSCGGICSSLPSLSRIYTRICNCFFESVRKIGDFEKIDFEIIIGEDWLFLFFIFYSRNNVLREEV